VKDLDKYLQAESDAKWFGVPQSVVDKLNSPLNVARVSPATFDQKKLTSFN